MDEHIGKFMSIYMISCASTFLSLHLHCAIRYSIIYSQVLSLQPVRMADSKEPSTHERPPNEATTRHPGKRGLDRSTAMLRILTITCIVKWYRGSWYNATILGMCSFAAPGLWGAMNSLGAGGAASPEVVNTANALIFCLMIVSCYFSSVLVKYVGIRASLCIGL